MWVWIVAQWIGSRRSIRRIMREVLARRLAPIAVVLLLAACSSFTSSDAPTSETPDAGFEASSPDASVDPRPVTPDPPVSVSAGAGIGCVLRKSGAVDCWGDNADGAITAAVTGQNACSGFTTACVPAATRSPLAGRALQISVGDGFVCAIVEGAPNAVMCWGKNRLGTLGDPDLPSSSIPVQVALSGGALDIAAGRGNACARVLVGGTAKVECWGTNAIGINGKAPSSERQKPVAVEGLDGASALFLSITDPASACVIDAQSLVRCWGGNAYGALGRSPDEGGCTVDGTYAANDYRCSSIPQLARALDPAKALATGVFTTCVTRPTGELSCWGFNGWGGHAIGLVDNNAHDAASEGGKRDFTKLSGRSGHFCGLTADGVARCWGAAGQGQLGDGGGELVNGVGFVRLVQPKPQAVGLVGVTDISAGEDFTLAIADGEVYAWGMNARGQLGHDPAQDGPCESTGFCNGTPTRVVLPQLAVTR